MPKVSAERSVVYLGLFSTLTFVVGLIFVGIAPSLDHNFSYQTTTDQDHFHKPYSDLELRGRLVYEREGCMYCHSQQLRPLVSEMERYGVGTSPAVPSDEREYVYDEPHFLGTKRNGPDLSRVGGKYSDDWQYSHLFNPAQMTPGSIMPAFTWLFTVANPADPSSPPVPKQDAVALVAYLQSEGRDRMVFDPTLDNGNGAWRPWLKPADAVISQEQSQAAVVRSTRPVQVTGGEKAKGST